VNWFGIDKWKETKISLREIQNIVAAYAQKQGEWFHFRSYEKLPYANPFNQDITKQPPKNQC
jgi:hypothetical protein